MPRRVASQRRGGGQCILSSCICFALNRGGREHGRENILSALQGGGSGEALAMKLQCISDHSTNATSNFGCTID
jgi:hypothetical protein